MKQWRNTIVFVLVVAALGLYVSKFERGEVREKPLALKIDPKEVAAFEIKSEKTKEPILFERKDSKEWHISKPSDLRADNQAVNDLFDKIVKLGQVRVITKAPSKSELSNFGLSSPKATIALHLKGGKTLTLELGDKSFDSMDVYAQQRGKKKVFLVEVSLFDNVDKELKDFRDKTALRLEKDKVEKFALAYTDSALEFQRAGDDWKLMKPMETAADKTEVDNLLQKIIDLKADNFVEDNPTNIRQYSIDKPWIRVDAWKRGQTRAETLFIGRKSSKDTGKVFAQNSAEKPVFLLADSVLKDLKKKPEDLRSKKVLSVDKANIERFRLVARKETLEVERTKTGDDETWAVLQPTKSKADKTEVDNLLYAVSDLQAKGFVDKPGPLKRFGLEAPSVEVSLWVHGESTPKVLQVGKKSSEAGNLFVKTTLADTVYKVADSLLDNLKMTPGRFRDKELLSLKKEDVKRITLRHSGQTITLVQAGKDKWEITSPKRAEADSSKVSSVFWSLESLRGDDFVAEKPATLAPYGLDKPQVEAEIDIKGQGLKTVLLGNRLPKGDKVYLMLKGGSVVLDKSDYILTDLKKTVDDLKKK